MDSTLTTESPAAFLRWRIHSAFAPGGLTPSWGVTEHHYQTLRLLWPISALIQTQVCVPHSHTQIMAFYDACIVKRPKSICSTYSIGRNSRFSKKVDILCMRRFIELHPSLSYLYIFLLIVKGSVMSTRFFVNQFQLLPVHPSLSLEHLQLLSSPLSSRRLRI